MKDVSKRGFWGSMFGYGNLSKANITITTKSEKLLEEDTKVHMAMLPSTCLIHKKLIHFVSGFRNYAAKILLKEAQLGEFKKPGGNVAISCFPTILDNPDILEIFVKVWCEDVVNKWTTTQKKQFETLMRSADEYIQKVYPILFADGDDDFHVSGNNTESACGDDLKLQRR